MQNRLPPGKPVTLALNTRQSSRSYLFITRVQLRFWLLLRPEAAAFLWCPHPQRSSYTAITRQVMKIPAFLAFLALATGCAQQQESQPAPPSPPALPVTEVRASSESTYQEYPASIEGAANVEIRPQVAGLLERILVDEGAYVRKGQPLFKINDAPYRERLSGVAPCQCTTPGAMLTASPGRSSWAAAVGPDAPFPGSTRCPR
jgi:hypothetical protein